MLNKTVALGLGSNLGSPIQNLRLTLKALKKFSFLKIKNISSIYESDALLPKEASTEWNKSYLNAVVLAELTQEITPLELLKAVKKLEKELGREVSARWAPRAIDIDILFWDGADFSSEELQIPHSRILERPFALLPLIEVWPEIKSKFEFLPSWSHSWVSQKPFQTRISSNFFWPKFVGILNITPDSFSDGGKFLQEEQLSQQLEKLKHQGADVIDIGAESTRPGAAAVSEDEELQRLNWAFKVIEKSGIDFEISLDSRRSAVVKNILSHYKVNFLNDVMGFEDLQMQSVLKESRLPAFVMHSLSIPPNKEKVLSDKSSPVGQLADWWQAKLQSLEACGIDKSKLIFDPGIGFGKTAEQSMHVLANLDQFSDIECDIIIGHSRKSFQTIFSNREASKRDLETALITQNLNLAFTQYLRVHDIETQKTALRSRGAVGLT